MLASSPLRPLRSVIQSNCKIVFFVPFETGTRRISCHLEEESREDKAKELPGEIRSEVPH
jgi:hypothetical protein